VAIEPSPGQPESPIRGTPTTHPTGFWFIFFGELAERCSFYGMRALLAFYLIDVFAKTRAQASEVVHLYMAGCYATGLLGGFIADRFLGKYWTIVLFAVPYIVGQLLVGQSDLGLMYVALVILAFGSGVIKPNISTLMGMTYDQQRPGQDQLRTRAFGYFYMAINIGSFLSYQVCPVLRDYFAQINPETGKPATPESARAGYLAAFLFPAALMAVALVIFAVGRRYYAHENVRENRAADAANPVNKWAVVGRLAGLFVLVMFFWVVFDQKTTTWIYFASDYLDIRFTTPVAIGGKTDWRIPPESLMAANPFLIICLVPLLNWVYGRLAARGYTLRATDKMTAGFVLTAGACAVHAWAGHLATNPDGSITRVSVMWQMLAYLLLTLAEVLISVTGLELAYTAAPRSLKSFVTSLWLMPVFFANLLSSQLAKTYPNTVKPGETVKAPVFELYKYEFFAIPQFHSAQAYFLALTVGLLVVAAAFVVVARRFNRSQERAALRLQSGGTASTG
jgi:POT family proton-dependent oligopeptide transporter